MELENIVANTVYLKAREGKTPNDASKNKTPYQASNLIRAIWWCSLSTISKIKLDALSLKTFRSALLRLELAALFC